MPHSSKKQPQGAAKKESSDDDDDDDDDDSDSDEGPRKVPTELLMEVGCLPLFGEGLGFAHTLAIITVNHVSGDSQVQFYISC